MVVTSFFQTYNGFCPDCGSILPPLKNSGHIKCYTCPSTFPVESFKSDTVKYTIHFNSKIAPGEGKNKKDDEGGEEGPVVERKCPKCGNEKMSYATLQLRSADEGQTVFYTCTSCKFKENENS